MTRREKAFTGLVYAVVVAEVAKRAVREEAATLGLSALQVAALAGLVSAAIGLLDDL